MKNLFLAFSVLVLASLPFSATGQELIPFMPGSGAAVGYGMGMPGPGVGRPGIGWGTRPRFSDELWQANLYCKTGPSWFNLTFDVPFNVPPTNVNGNLLPTFNFESLRLTVNQEPFWSGFVGLELQPAPGFILYGEIGGNIKRDGAEVYMEATGRAFLPANPANADLDSPPNTTSPWVWKTNNFQWWMIDAGMGYTVNSVLTVEVGFREEHFDFKLVDPRNFTTPIPDRTLAGNRAITSLIVAPRICPSAVGQAIGDPLEKTWIPYLGIRGVGRRCCGKDCNGRPLTTVDYKWRLRGSPFAWNYWSDPMKLNFFCPPIPATEINQALYTMNGSNGLFLDAEIEGDMPLSSALAVNFWWKGSWLSFSGQPVNLDFTVLNQGTVTPGSEIFGATPGSASSNEGSFQRSFYSLGVSLDLTI